MCVTLIQTYDQFVIDRLEIVLNFGVSLALKPSKEMPLRIAALLLGDLGQN